MAGTVSSTSLTRWAATSALGRKMKTMPIIMNDMMMTMEYVMNAIMSPVWMVPSSIYDPPTHTIKTETAFMTSMIAG